MTFNQKDFYKKPQLRYILLRTWTPSGDIVCPALCIGNFLKAKRDRVAEEMKVSCFQFQSCSDDFRNSPVMTFNQHSIALAIIGAFWYNFDGKWFSMSFGIELSREETSGLVRRGSWQLWQLLCWFTIILKIFLYQR